MADTYRFADLTLDVGQRRLIRDAADIALGKLTFDLLLALVRSAPNVVTHDALVEQVWGGRITSPETVTQRVKLLRDALGDDAENPRYIALARNQGYRLIPPVEAPAVAAQPAPRRGLRIAGIAVAAAGALGVLVFAMMRDRVTPAPAPVTLAVLPLVNLSSDSSQEYFADGMTEALIASLAKLSGLSVISRTSTMRYKESSKSVPEIARELKVSTILEGSAQMEGSRVRITAQLIDAQTDKHLWAESYDRDLKDVLALQNDVARDIARAIAIAMTPGEVQRLTASRVVNPEMYKAYLRGMYHLNKSTPDDVQKGLAFLHEAVDKDPGDALAYAGLALGYATYGHGPSPKPDVWPRARAAALRAVQLDPNLAEAHAALADVMLYMEHDWKAAERGFLRANELSPSLATNHFHYAWYLALFGRWEEAVAEHKRAQELDPLTPSHTHWLGGMYLYNSLSRHAEANTEALRALELQPDNPSALLVLGMAQSAAGKHEKAIATHLKMVQLDPSLKWELGVSYLAAGRDADARAILDELQREPPNSWNAYGQAVLNARLGNLDKAFEWLAYDPPHAWVPWVRVDPWLRPYIEKDPRFPALLERMHLPL